MSRGDIKLAIDRCNAHDLPDVADLLASLATQLEAANSLVRKYREESDASKKREPAWVLFQNCETGHYRTLLPHEADEFARDNELWTRCGNLYKEK